MAGADFIKTSTGKEAVSSTLKSFYSKTKLILLGQRKSSCRPLYD